MSNTLEPTHTYETMLHGQLVTVKRYPYKAPTDSSPWGRGFRWDNKRKPRAAETMWEMVQEEVQFEPDKNTTDYSAIRAAEPLADMIDWDAVGSDYNPEADRNG